MSLGDPNATDETPYPTLPATAAHAGQTPAERRRRRSVMPEEVQFPVTPMLDMAFQLLAFFVLTFQPPSPETHIDLDFPATPVALPGAAKGEARPQPPQKTDSDIENDLWVRAESDDLGDLKGIRLGDAQIPDVPTLGQRLRRYAEVLEGRPLRVRLVADDGLRWEESARVIAECSAAGVSAVRLASPESTPIPAGANPGTGPG